VSSHDAESSQAVAWSPATTRAPSMSRRPRVLLNGLVPRSPFEIGYQIAVIVVPIIATAYVALLVRGGRMSAVGAVSLGVMYPMVGLGVTLGYHRLLTHRSFETHAWVRYSLAILGAMSGQGWFFNWIGEHRLHHACTDQPGDPHSPHYDGGTALHGLKGLLHSHLGWLIAPRTKGLRELIPDLVGDPVMRGIDRLSLFWMFAGCAGPGLVAYLATGRSSAFWDAALWGGPVRMLLLNHTTWCINSICHRFGTRDFESGDESRNNAVLGLMALGEGWHNNHHAFPRSARHGLLRGQADATYLVIRGLEAVGLAWGVVLPSERHLKRKAIGRGAEAT
jgi:stearoyl-CoA desaturase (delta-9 desaturase)